MNAFLDRYRDHGLLLARVGLGLMMIIVHGAPKLFGGPEVWAMVGGSMANFGIDFAPTFWGFCAAMAEFGGGIALILGVAVRPASAGLAFTMLVAAVMHLAAGEGLKGASHPVEVGVVFLGLILMGGGRFSLDAKLFGGRRQAAPDAALA